jgi:hypothetical protein
MTTFHVFQQVVCVDSSAREDGPTPTELTEGAVYHIAKIIDGGNLGIGFHLTEVPIASPFDGYYSDRFRPVVKPKKRKTTDISVLKKLLVGA